MRLGRVERVEIRAERTGRAGVVGVRMVNKVVLGRPAEGAEGACDLMSAAAQAELKAHGWPPRLSRLAEVGIFARVLARDAFSASAAM
jgi:hypothetical protein